MESLAHVHCHIVAYKSPIYTVRGHTPRYMSPSPVTPSHSWGQSHKEVAPTVKRSHSQSLRFFAYGFYVQVISDFFKVQHPRTSYIVAYGSKDKCPREGARRSCINFYDLDTEAMCHFCHITFVKNHSLNPFLL